MGQTPIAYIDIRVFSHATEDENKVLEAVKKIIPTDHIEEIIFEKHNTHGHHGNPIVFFETRIKKKETLQAIAENFSTHLNTLDKETLRANLSAHTEKGSLYIRLDKQAAFKDTFKLTQADPIRIRLRFKKENIEGACQELGIIP